MAHASRTGVRPAWPVRSRRLALRPPAPADAARMAAYRSRPEVCRYVPFEPMDEETVRRRIEEVWTRRDLTEGGQTLFVCFELAEAGRVIGDGILHWTSAEHGCAEIGYVLDPEYRGRGYATEAAHRLLHLAFDGLGAHRVVARVDARNSASARVVERLGMRLEAHLVENEWFKGQWSDELDFALLDREWRHQHLDGCSWDGDAAT
jgi:RimJ/RimL family protein N-acetyltransferase